MMAIASGTLVVANGCIWLRNATGDALVIWPASYVASVEDGRIAITDAIDHRRSFIGDEVKLGGGEVHDDPAGRDHVEGLIGTRIPDACPARRYWIGGLMEAGQ